MSVSILIGDCRERLAELPDASVHCCVTSPPYFNLRDYGEDGQVGLEETPDAYVTELVEVFREVRRVLRDDGTLWLNLGDSYAGSWGAQGRTGQMADRSVVSARQIEAHPQKASRTGSIPDGSGLKPKDLFMIPARVALALQADGWWLRSEIIWNKPNPMPESVRDRPTSAHEKVFLLAKSSTYYYDADAIAEPSVSDHPSGNGFNGRQGGAAHHARSGGSGSVEQWTPGGTRNRRNVWTIPTRAFAAAHFATFPPELIEPCILAGCPEGGTVLDPFGGAGTTGLVADRLGRDAILIELNPEYAEMAERRIHEDASLLVDVELVR